MRPISQRLHILGRGLWRSGLVDRGDVLEVKLISGQLESVSEEALLGGANVAAIGDGSSGNWEVFQFSHAELVAEGTYWLSDRLRGQAGSDGLIPETWPAGSTFVLLNGAPSRIEMSPSLRQVVQHFRIGPAQRGPSDPSYRYLAEAFAGNGLRPYSPCHLQVSGSFGTDLGVNWVRRTRIEGDSWEGPDVPLGEESESYLVRVMQGTAILREAIIASPQWNYTSAQQSADEVTVPFEISVAQISASYGAGLENRITISA